MAKFNFSKIKSWNGFGRRQVVLAGLVIMIGVAGYINWSYQEPVDGGAVPTVAEPAQTPDTGSAANQPEQDDYFSAARYDREKARSSSMAVFREIVENDQSSADAKEQAQADLSASAKNGETENILESLIKAKGFEDAVCYIQSDSVNVVVKTEGLTPAQAAQIKDLAVEKTGFGADKIKILEIK